MMKKLYTIVVEHDDEKEAICKDCRYCDLVVEHSMYWCYLQNRKVDKDNTTCPLTTFNDVITKEEGAYDYFVGGQGECV